MPSCNFCGKTIHFDSAFKSKKGKHIPLSGARGSSEHRCKARPFDRETRREYARQQQAAEEQRRRRNTTTTSSALSLPRYYNTIGFSPFIQHIKQDIKRAYQKLVMLYRPDRSHDPSTIPKFIAVREAYEKYIVEAPSS